MEIHQFPMFSASEDIKYLICLVTSQNYVIEGLCNFLSGCVTTLLRLVVIGIVVVEIYF